MSRRKARKKAMIFVYQTLLREAINQEIDRDAFLHLEPEFKSVIAHIFKGLINNTT